MRLSHLVPLPWREPADILRRLADLPYSVGLLSDGSSEGQWSYVASHPAAVFDSLQSLAAGLERWKAAAAAAGPPFQGGAIGLAGYEWGASLEPCAPQERSPHWPDFTGGFYDAVYAFDHASKTAWAIGRGETTDAAAHCADRLARDFVAGEASFERRLRSSSFPREHQQRGLSGGGDIRRGVGGGGGDFSGQYRAANGAARFPKTPRRSMCLPNCAGAAPRLSLPISVCPSLRW